MLDKMLPIGDPSPESLGRTSMLQASLVVSEMVEPVQGSNSTEPEPGKHNRLPKTFSAAAPGGGRGGGTHRSHCEQVTRSKVERPACLPSRKISFYSLEHLPLQVI